ncbi:unnamed protein product [Rhizoctonia solani]|uniref:Adenosine deaminase domain-containing protein n=1 Tax=Rhizoctonia solani TaxID=456999 RepID=A0A8H2XV79_9AGAM|nr:unnamed protein product [Rhizoctonia solani]
MVPARNKKRALDIPFIFLVGESMGEKNKADRNLYDALLLGTKRIGHGLNLVRHPLLMQMIKEQGVAVEVCPIVNEIPAIISSESCDILSLKQLARQSLEYSTLSIADKKSGLEAWEQKWAAFVDRIVDANKDL